MNDANFQLDPEEGFRLIDVDDIDDLVNGNTGISHEEITTLGLEEYRDMIMDECPEDDDKDAIDKYINCELILDVGTNNEHHGHVIKRSWGLDGEPIGQAHTNPLFDTREYEIEFTDGLHEKYMANIIAEYMVANRLVDKPAFKWWVPHTIRKRNQIIKKVKSRYWRTMHKFGVRLPHSVEEALKMDEEMGTDFWRHALKKEMAKVKVAWAVKEGHSPEQAR